MPNDHENDSETRGEKNNCGRREGDLHPLLQAGTHLVLVAMRPDKKRLKKKHSKNRSKRRMQSFSIESQPKRSDMLTERSSTVDEKELDPPELTNYTNDHFNILIQVKKIKDNILIKTPVPSNVQEVKKMYEFMIRLLTEKCQNALPGKNLEKILDVMISLRKLLQSLE